MPIHSTYNIPKFQLHYPNNYAANELVTVRLNFHRVIKIA